VLKYPEVYVSDTTLLSHFIANLNTNVFLREFSFSQTRFTPTAGGTQVELADHVVRIGHLLFLYQLKERDSSATTTIDKWLKKKVVTRATKQIRATTQLLNSHAPVLVANERGHVFDLEAKPGDQPFRLVLFKSGDKRTSLPFPRFHRSTSAGFIHIFDALDYFGICQYLLTPIEMAEYLIWREAATQSTTDAQLVSEAALLGQYMVEDLESSPAECYAEALAALHMDVSSFDLSFLFNGLGDRIEYASPDDRETSYYPLLQCLAQMPRSALRLLKERLRFALEAVNDDRFESPVRFVYPALDCGFLLVPIAAAHFDSRLIALWNLSLAAKYDRHTTHQVGISIARRNSDYMIDWYYASFPWSHDADLEALLRENYPFRPISESPEPRYQFSTERLQQSGLLRGKPDSI
jgi:hypothetical protein